MKKEFKRIPFQVTETKEIEEDGQRFGIIKGYGSTFGNVDRGGDRVIKGAFKKTLASHRKRNRQVRMLSQHRILIGGWPKFKEDDNGLLLEGRVNLQVQKGLEAYSLAKQGVLEDLSIGYWATDTEWVTEDGKEIRNLKEIDLFEVSIVDEPMNIMAQITDVKTMTDVSDFLKSIGLSNKEATNLIHDIKKLSRKDDNEDENDNTRNDVLGKLDEIIINQKLEEVINKLT